MGGKCLNKRLSCECGSSDGIQVFLQDDGTEDGYCFACGKYYNASDIKGEPQTAVVIPMVRQETKMNINKIKNQNNLFMLASNKIPFNIHQNLHLHQHHLEASVVISLFLLLLHHQYVIS